MIIDSGNDKKGKFYKAGMIERLSLNLENYASSEWGNRFYQDDFLEGLCQQRNRIHANVNKTFGGLLILTTILAFLDSATGTVNFWGVEFSIPELGSLALCVAVALSFLAMVFAFLDQLIIDRLLDTLGNRIGAYTFPLVLLNLGAVNLWALAATPKYHGISSDIGHRSVLPILTVFFVVLGGIAIIFPAAIVYHTISTRILPEFEIIELVLSLIAATIFFMSYLIMFLFCFSYKFRPSSFPEPSTPFIPEDFIDLGHPYLPETKEQFDKTETKETKHEDEI